MMPYKPHREFERGLRQQAMKAKRKSLRDEIIANKKDNDPSPRNRLRFKKAMRDIDKFHTYCKRVQSGFINNHPYLYSVPINLPYKPATWRDGRYI